MTLGNRVNPFAIPGEEREVSVDISPSVRVDPFALPEEEEDNSLLRKAVEPVGKGILKVFDILSRPLFAVAGATKELVEEGVSGQVITEAIKGFKGEERDTFSDVLGSLGWEPTGRIGKIAKGITGFALDVLLDPVTYIGLGGLTKVGKAAKKIGDLAPTVRGQVKQGQRALLTWNPLFGKIQKDPVVILQGEKVFESFGSALDFIRTSKAQELQIDQKAKDAIDLGRQLVDKLGTAFIPSFRPSSVDPTLWKMFTKIKTGANNVDAYKSSKALEKANQIAVLTNLAMKTHPDDLLLKTLTAIEKPSKIKGLPDDLQNIVKISREYLDELKEVRKWAKKNIIDSDDFKYIPHIHEQGFMNDMRRIFGQSKIYTTSSSSDISRNIFKFLDETGETFHFGTPEEAGLKLINAELNLYQTKFGETFTAVLPTIEEKIQTGVKRFSNIETDIPVLVGIAGKRASKLQKSRVFFDQVSELSINEAGIDNLIPGVTGVKVKAPELKGLKFHPELAKEIDKTYDLLVSPKEIEGLLRGYDNVQNLWKATVTFVNPAFHSRNMISNFYQNWLGGVNSPKPYVDSLKMMNNIRKGVPLGEAQAQLMREFEEQGLKKGFFSVDVIKDISQQVSPTVLGSQTMGKIYATGGKIGEWIETQARLAHFLDKRAKGFNPAAAGDEVKKYLFDYSDLTDLERNVFKRLVPFYTWMRKNIPLQVQKLIERPHYAVTTGKVKIGIEKSVDTDRVDKSLVPEWLKEAAPIYLGIDEQGRFLVAKMEGYIPLADVGKMTPGQIKRQALSSLSPLIKGPWELFANYNTYFGENIERFEGEKKEFLRIKVNPYLEYMLRQVRPFAELDKLIGKPLKDDETLAQAAKARAFNFLVGGKIYKIDPAKQRNIKQFQKRKRIGTLKSAARLAIKRNDPKERDRLLKLIREAKKGGI